MFDTFTQKRTRDYTAAYTIKQVTTCTFVLLQNKLTVLSDIFVNFWRLCN